MHLRHFKADQSYNYMYNFISVFVDMLQVSVRNTLPTKFLYLKKLRLSEKFKICLPCAVENGDMHFCIMRFVYLGGTVYKFTTFYFL